MVPSRLTHWVEKGWIHFEVRWNSETSALLDTFSLLAGRAHVCEAKENDSN
jgi:hypothetical protein